MTMRRTSQGVLAVLLAAIGWFGWPDTASAQNRGIVVEEPPTDIYGRPLPQLRNQMRWESMLAEVTRRSGNSILVNQRGEDHVVRLNPRTGIIFAGDGDLSYLKPRTTVIGVTGTMADKNSITAEKITIFVGGQQPPMGIHSAEDYVDPSELFEAGAAKPRKFPAQPGRNPAAPGGKAAGAPGGRAPAAGGNGNVNVPGVAGGRKPAAKITKKAEEELASSGEKIFAVGRVTTVEPLRFKPSTKVLVINDADSAKVTVLLGPSEANKLKVAPEPGDSVHLIGYEDPSGMILATEVVIRKDKIPNPSGKGARKPAKSSTTDEPKDTTRKPAKAKESQ